MIGENGQAVCLQMGEGEYPKEEGGEATEPPNLRPPLVHFSTKDVKVKHVKIMRNLYKLTEADPIYTRISINMINLT